MQVAKQPLAILQIGLELDVAVLQEIWYTGG